MKRFVNVQVQVDQMPEFSWQTFALIEADKPQVASTTEKIVSADGRVLENAFVQATITSNGSLTIKEKATGKELTDLLVLKMLAISAMSIFSNNLKGTAPFTQQLFLIKLRSSQILLFMASLK